MHYSTAQLMIKFRSASRLASYPMMVTITHQESAHLVALMRVLLLLRMGKFRLPVAQRISPY